MDPDIENVIRHALADAKDAGKDHLTQTELAVRAVQRARSDMTASDALTAVCGGAKVVHGSGGIFPSAGGAKLCHL